MAFSKLLKYQSEWNKLNNALSNREYKLEENEIVPTKLFLKQLANEYYDMELLSNGIIDKSKLNKAKDISKDFRSKIRQIDDEISKGNYNIINANYKITSVELSDFLDLLRDVPDEL